MSACTHSHQSLVPEIHIHLHMPEFRPVVCTNIARHMEHCHKPCVDSVPVANCCNTPCRPKCDDGCKCGGKGGCIILNKNPVFCNQM
uniref:Uncharacterized protein n=1 Tax=Clandestinovirus TaxID=2831644 RepID=A0A8F8PMM6_9VIRU|nr:hypothetical protein KOM_12_397 [Clandestinovirus]